MFSTDGDGPKRIILYARVSTEEQARSGYSLAQQLEALREYATREGYEILEEVTDPGQSGASLERPGLDRVRDLVAAGGVSVVLAQDRDRFAREPAYHYLLRREFKEHACKLRALNDRSDESPEGELTDGILDQLAKYERAKIAERTRRGKLRRAREGKIIPTGTPNYGFRYNDARENYIVDEEAMQTVRRIFYMVGVEGCSLRAVRKKLQTAGIPTPRNKEYWSRTFIRRVIMDDVYRPYTYEEVKEMVAPGVATWLDPEKRYGICWFNRTRVTKKQVVENDLNGKRYRRMSKTTHKPASEWIAIPVPDSGIPRDWVDAAKEAIKDNRTSSSAGHRFWELSGGILRCGECGYAMEPSSTLSSKKRFFYYRCPKPRRVGKEACSQRKNYRADKVEPQVWGLVSGLLKDPEQLRADLERMIEEEHQGLCADPHRETKVWLQKLAEVDQMRGGYQALAAKGLMTFEELGEKLQDLEETRNTAKRELDALQSQQARIEELERDKDTLLESYAEAAPEALESLTPEERHQVYKMLRLRVVAQVDGTLEVRGAFGAGFDVCEKETVS
jgi:site-specific DNA recombinase